jgi:2-dehydro-3-deoxyphosphogluconate aldolase / (4S)-4-hydroxy-2-oxoglutarate aldolase
MQSAVPDSESCILHSALPSTFLMHRADIVARIVRERIVAVLRLDDRGKLRAVADALVAGGVRVLEVTMTVPNAIDVIAQLVSAHDKDVLIGAGTVVDTGTAARAIDAGAKFVVSPVLRPAVMAECHRLGLPAFPGCFTPTEILNAWDAGADIVKVFPATALGPTFFKDVLAPLPQLKLMPTGGVSIENASDWLRAGAVAVGIGSALIDAAAMKSDDFAAITRNAERLVANVRAVVAG